MSIAISLLSTQDNLYFFSLDNPATDNIYMDYNLQGIEIPWEFNLVFAVCLFLAGCAFNILVADIVKLWLFHSDQALC